MNQNPFRPIPNQEHSSEIADHEGARVDGVDSLIEFIEEGHPFGDVAVPPGETRKFSPADLARRIQAGEDW